MTVLSEHSVFVADAAQYFPPRRGKPLNTATIRLWIKEGVDGVRLEAVRAGRSFVTSREAIERFCDELTKRGQQS